MGGPGRRTGTRLHQRGRSPDLCAIRDHGAAGDDRPWHRPRLGRRAAWRTPREARLCWLDRRTRPPIVPTLVGVAYGRPASPRLARCAAVRRSHPPAAAERSARTIPLRKRHTPGLASPPRQSPAPAHARLPHRDTAGSHRDAGRAHRDARSTQRRTSSRETRRQRGPSVAVREKAAGAHRPS